MPPYAGFFHDGNRVVVDRLEELDELTYPLVMSNIAIENGHRNSGFSH